jgi:hypothetical protein
MSISVQRTLLLLLLTTLLSACASNDIYRNDFKSCVVTPQELCESHAIQHHKVGSDQEYMVGFVEIDDQGQLRDRAQMQALLDELYNMAAKESVLINVFVHGWHHNAKPGDANVESFKNSLAQLSHVEHTLHDKPRKVVGVYVGWRGESIDVPYLNNITFWDRKNTAEDVGHLGMAELLLRLEEISNVKNTQEPPVKSRLVVVGHSFGGAAVYSATSQILADRFVDSRGDKNFVDTAKGFGDLVVLLNPAFEALSYAPLYDLAQARCSYFDNQQPKLVVLTSETDYATKYLFPMGRFFSTFFETHGDIARNDCKRPLSYAEGEADRNTVGHFEPLQSHELHPASNIQAAQYGDAHNIWAQQQPGSAMQFGSTELVSLGKSAPLNPYLNVKVDKQLIKDHNDIFRPEIMEFLRMLIVLSTNE